LGEALHHLDKKGEAIEEYSAALSPESRPKIVQAYFNRGLVYLDLSAWQQALDDFDQASARGCREDMLQGGRGIALAHLGRDREANTAFARAWATGRVNPELRLSYAFLISPSRPEEAREIFLNVLEQDPDNPRAMYGCGMLLEHQRRDSEEAAAWFSRALKQRPTLVEARLARALVRAHQGRWDTARQEIDLSVELEPTGRTLYAAACFYALLSAAREDPLAKSWAEVALTLLGEALKKGYGQEQMAQDPDLDAVRQHPKFLGLLEQARKPKDSR
jgi:tetratricopeptide (TPR) repeat protein